MTLCMVSMISLVKLKNSRDDVFEDFFEIKCLFATTETASGVKIHQHHRHRIGLNNNNKEKGEIIFNSEILTKKVKQTAFETTQAVNCLKVEFDAASLPS